MNLKTEDTLKRIKQIIKEICAMVDKFPRTPAGFRIGGQIIDSITSVGANFVEAQSARSKKEFVSIMAVSLKEINETMYWLGIIKDLRLTQNEKIDRMLPELRELAKILASIVITSSKTIH